MYDSILKERYDDNEEECYTFEKAFDLTGHGKFNRLVVMTCGLIHLSVVFESLCIGYILPAAECDLQLDSSHKGFLNAAASVGIMLVSFAWGFLGDKYGRRGVMLPAMILSIFMSTASAFSFNFTMMLILRVITGCLVSASNATVFAYMGELLTDKRRATSMQWSAVTISCGLMFLAGAAWVILPGTWKLSLVYIDFVPWRLMSLCGPITTTLASIALFFLPESPKYLYSKKGPDAVLPVLKMIYAVNFGVRPNSFPVKKISDSQELGSNIRSKISPWIGFTLLFKMPLLRCVAIAYTFMFFNFLLGNGIYVWVPDLLNTLLNGNTNGDQSVCDIIYNRTKNTQEILKLSTQVENGCVVHLKTEIFPIVIVMAVAGTLVYITIAVLVKRIGKRLICGSIMAICGISCSLVWMVRSSAVATILFLIVICSGTCGSVLTLITIEVFPTELRVMAVSGMYMVGRAGSAISASLLGVFLPTRCELAFTSIGLLSAASPLLLLLWPRPEDVKAELENQGWTF